MKTKKQAEAKQVEPKQELCDKGCSDHSQMMLGAISNATPILKVASTLLLALARDAYRPDGEPRKKVELDADEAEALGVALYNVTRRLEECECPSPEEIAAAAAVQW